MDPALAAIKNFRSASPEIATSGQPQEWHFPLMAREGFAAVINLALHDDPRYSLPDEASSVRAAGMEYIHIPVQFAAPTHADLVAFMDAMTRLEGQKVWIHCAANMRVTAFLGLYRALRLKWDRERAFELMQSVWEPDATWKAFMAGELGGTQRHAFLQSGRFAEILHDFRGVHGNMACCGDDLDLH